MTALPKAASPSAPEFPVQVEAGSLLPSSATASSTNILRNVGMSYMTTAVAMLSGFFVTPLLVRVLGSEQFGLWTLLLGTVAYLGLLDLGISTAVAKRVAECHATGNYDRLARVLGTALAMFSGLSLALMLAAFLLLPNLESFLRVPPAYAVTAKIALILLAAQQSATFLYNVQASVFYGAGRLDLMTRVTVVSTLISTALNVLLVLRGYGIVTLASIMLASTLVVWSVSSLLLRRHFPEIRMRVWLAEGRIAGELIHAGLRNAALSVSGALASGADPLILNAFLPLANVTHYAVAAKLSNVIRTIASRPVGMLLPAFAHCDTLGDHERQVRLYTRGVLLSLVLSLPAAIFLFSFGDRVILAWAGPGHGSAFPVLVLQAAALVVQMQSWASCMLLTATERNIVLIKIVVCSAIANLGLSILFTWSFGLIGPSLGTLACVCVVDGFLVPREACRQVGCAGGEYFRRALGPLLWPTLASVFVAVGARLVMPPGAVWTVAVGALVGLVFVLVWSPRLLTGTGSFKQRLHDSVSFA